MTMALLRVGASVVIRAFSKGNVSPCATPPMKMGKVSHQSEGHGVGKNKHERLSHDVAKDVALSIKRRCEYFRPSHARFMAMAAVPSEATVKTAPIWEGVALYNRSASRGK